MMEEICKHCGHTEGMHYVTPSGSTRCSVAGSSESQRGVVGIRSDWRCQCSGFEPGTFVPPETAEQREIRQTQERILDGIARDGLAELTGKRGGSDLMPADPSVRKGPYPAPPAPDDATQLCTTSGRPWTEESRELRPNGQQKDYRVLCSEERAKGFVRPVRCSYEHVGTSTKRGCGTVTTMGRALAETYARDPKFYGATFCVGCGVHLPVGEHGEFVWAGTDERVGT